MRSLRGTIKAPVATLTDEGVRDDIAKDTLTPSTWLSFHYLYTSSEYYPGHSQSESTNPANNSGMGALAFGAIGIHEFAMQ